MTVEIHSMIEIAPEEFQDYLYQMAHSDADTLVDAMFKTVEHIAAKSPRNRLEVMRRMEVLINSITTVIKETPIKEDEG